MFWVADLPVVEPAVVEDTFVEAIGRIEEVAGTVYRFSLCVSEKVEGQRCYVVKTKLLVPHDCVKPMAIQAVTYASQRALRSFAPIVVGE